MLRKLLLTAVLTLLLPPAIAQRVEKVFLNKADSTKSNYTLLHPTKSPYQGLVVIVPGFGETADNVFLQTALPQLTAQNGLLTMIPTFQDGNLSFGVDSASQQSLQGMIKDVMRRYKLAEVPFYIGGFSIGGSCAIKYAENALIKPAAVFAIDPPLDFERFYNAAKRDVRLSRNTEPSRENIYMIQRIEREAKGSPETHIAGYYKLSPYSFSDTTQLALQNIINTPIKIYSEPDVSWWLANRGADLTSMNATGCSALINELNRLGNKNATLEITHDKGYRKPNNIRHPHSWSIADSDELVKWLLTYGK